MQFIFIRSFSLAEVEADYYSISLRTEHNCVIIWISPNFIQKAGKRDAMVKSVRGKLSYESLVRCLSYREPLFCLSLVKFTCVYDQSENLLFSFIT